MKKEMEMIAEGVTAGTRFLSEKLKESQLFPSISS
ncbi:hypothetical protein SLEP1_g26936 [Rubroshorea leprosula]|uniref:Uncharacterized protein n=1 Tax=Rubroshorea leprosula TaxID=152421 RepID=A0AAV5JNT8_9ROSI|nr:hypothetical protein SLEP1_g26936 [Rubroshorea leprosula]